MTGDLLAEKDRIVGLRGADLLHEYLVLWNEAKNCRDDVRRSELTHMCGYVSGVIEAFMYRGERAFG